jgi:hypothetical protein
MNKQFLKLAVSVAGVGLIALPLSFGFAQTTEPAKPSATPQTAACSNHEQHAGCAHAHQHGMQGAAMAAHRHHGMHDAAAHAPHHRMSHAHDKHGMRGHRGDRGDHSDHEHCPMHGGKS